MSPRSLHLAIAASLLGLIALTALGRFSEPARVENVRERGRLIVAMGVGPASYQRGEDGKPSGFEYELISGFAERLEITLDVRPVANAEQAMALLENGTVDLAAATLSPTPERRARFAFTDGYLQTQPRLIYRQGAPAPETLEDVTDARVAVLAHSIPAKRLRRAAEEHPGLTWRALEHASAEELLYRVWRERSDYAVTDELRLTLNRPFYPELRAGPAVGPPRTLAWMLRPGDRELLALANDHLSELRAEGSLTVLRDEYFGHLAEFDYVGTRTFLRHITERLPRFRPLFREGARTHGMDWRLLAAVGYQESHWNPDAVSPTGVRGVMMLTRNTADFVGIDNRRDPAQSIRGGAEYLASLRERLPDDIPEPSRTWFTLAAYNVGLGHLYDAQTITRMRGGDPDKWFDLRKNLPLLSQKKWYEQVKYGYARGGEPVQYVENIRRYYQLLRRVTDLGQPATPTVAREALLPAPLRVPPAIESIL